MPRMGIRDPGLLVVGYSVVWLLPVTGTAIQALLSYVFECRMYINTQTNKQTNKQQFKQYKYCTTLE
jgi:hypothetical protein